MIRPSKYPRQLMVICLALAAVSLACDLGNAVQISFGNPTPTSTRTPRPTFTPRVESTPTPEDTETPAPTETPAKSPTNTRPAVVVAPRTATKAPPAATPVPSFALKLINSYGCGQDGIYEIVGSIRRPGGFNFIPGYVMALLTPDGRILKTAVSGGNEEMFQEAFTNCLRNDIVLLNFKLDATEFRAMGRLQVRAIKSASDPSPVSQTITVDMGVPGRTYIFFDAP